MIFRPFEGQNTTPMNPVKTLYSITFHERGHLLDIDVSATVFYIIWCATFAGGLVDLGLHRIYAVRFREILESGDRTQLGATAPAQGLA